MKPKPLSPSEKYAILTDALERALAESFYYIGSSSLAESVGEYITICPYAEMAEGSLRGAVHVKPARIPHSVLCLSRSLRGAVDVKLGESLSFAESGETDIKSDRYLIHPLWMRQHAGSVGILLGADEAGGTWLLPFLVERSSFWKYSHAPASLGRDHTVLLGDESKSLSSMFEANACFLVPLDAASLLVALRNLHSAHAATVEIRYHVASLQEKVTEEMNRRVEHFRESVFSPQTWGSSFWRKTETEARYIIDTDRFSVLRAAHLLPRAISLLSNLSPALLDVVVCFRGREYSFALEASYPFASKLVCLSDAAESPSFPLGPHLTDIYEAQADSRDYVKNGLISEKARQSTPFACLRHFFFL